MSRSDDYAQILSRMIQCETISFFGQEDLTKFEKFHALIHELFPNVFETLTEEVFHGSLLLRWKGTDASLDPALFMSHHDVVEAGGVWKHAPFSGDIAEGKVWGRGTMDTKGNLFGILQAIEELIQEGYVPIRDIYVESACNEETTGEGAAEIAKVLKDRGIHLYFTMDEGGMILPDPIGGANGTFAMIGVGEKCAVDLKFIAKSNGGHASTPGKNTPLVRLGKFMAAADASHIFTVEMEPVIQEMFRRIGPTMKKPLNTLTANIDKTKKLMEAVVPAISPTAAALLRTTLAFTMAGGSDGTNVLPQEAWIVGNMRCSHHQGKKGSIAAITKLAKKYDLTVEILHEHIESPIADYNDPPFKLVEKICHQIYPDVIPAPYLMTGASDSRSFALVCENGIRFAPFLISDQQRNSIHGLDENIDVSSLAPAVDFFKAMMKEL
ncbi:MAG: M20/M25/M40 family metallo-hydrolase [Firmicutes bacterium]|nr:M20/M25/M40 family metallo-hydrolase [Bacillota bacterium]